MKEKSIKDQWRDFKNDLIKSTKRMMAEDKSATEFYCKNCNKYISKKSFLKHKTEVGCKNIHPWVRLRKFTEDKKAGKIVPLIDD